jgi:Asp-tRNA(Asn)/Glu-tRNA(Gln) amidotransferase A subunit family amidase
MHGLPLGVQVVGKRLQEEKVLEGMKVIFNEGFTVFNSSDSDSRSLSAR